MFSQFDAEGGLLSVHTLMQDVNSFTYLSSNKRWLHKCLDKVKRLNDSLCPYFEVIDTVVQAYPQLASIVWGALWLTLKVRYT